MKKQLSKRLTALLLAFAICFSYALPASAAGTGKRDVAFQQVDNSEVSSSIPADRVVQEVEQEPSYKDSDSVRVSIVLEDASTIEAGFSTVNFAENELAVAYREQLRAEQETMTDTISRTALKGKKLDVVWNLTLAANIISANVNYGDIEQIKAVKGVADVVIETRYEPDVVSTEDTVDPNMATSSEMIGSGIAYAEGYYGKGSKIAVIDTGTDTDHKSFNADAFKYAVGEDADLMTAEDIAAVLDQLNIAGLVDDAKDLYLNAKLPFAFNYVDEDFDVTHDNDSQGEHGSHVAGISTANRYISNGDGTFTEALTAVHTQGVAPDAQLITMKVFGKGGGAYDSDYMAAIEDAIVLGADSINLSLGSGNPGMSHNSTAEYQAIMDSLTEAGAVVCISAGNSGTWQENTLYGYLYNDGVSMQTDGSPGSYTNAFTVASVTNSGNTGNFLNFGEGLEAVSFTESSGYTNEPIATLDTTGEGTEYDFVLFDNTGVDGSNNNLLIDYADVCKDKVVMVYRGTSSFYQKHDAVGEVGGIACIVVNNQAGTINMDLSDSTATIPCISIQLADGAALKALDTTTAVTDDNGSVLYYTGKVTISSAVQSVQGNAEYYTMSSFSSWGIPGSLEMKPEITAPGGNIYSVNGAVAGGEAYENMSGTSMASPQMAGMVAVFAEYIRENDLTAKTGLTARQLAQSLLMSTAEPLVEEDSGYYYSILNQGAGLANVGDAINAHSYITMADDANAGAADGKVKVELGDDSEKTGVYSFTYTLHNLTDSVSYFNLSTDVFTQDVFGANTYSGYEVLLDTWTAELYGATVSYTVNGEVMEEDGVQLVLDYCAGNGTLTNAQMAAYDLDKDGKITTYDAHLMLNTQMPVAVELEANGELEVTVTIDVTGCDFTYYPAGAYIEAYSYATECSTDEGVEGTTHSIPVLGYYGNWTDASMYDVGSLAEYRYETEERYPYLINETDALTNYLTVKYPNDNGEYYYFSNPLTDDDEYLEERNAFNSNGSLHKYYATVIRNAGNSKVEVTDVNTGEVYYSEELGSVYGAYYYSNGSVWYNTQSNFSVDWHGTDAEGNKLPEGTEVNVSLILAPEYYVTDDGTDWDALGEGAYMTTRTAIDNTAPEMSELVYDAEAKTLTVTASDNRYLATVALYANGVAKELGFVAPNQPLDKIGQAGSYVLDLSGTDSTELYIQLTDYAMNQTTYKFVLTEDGIDDKTVPATKITLTPAALSVVKGTTAAIDATFEPYMADETVIWTSANEEIATVENGVVTGVAVGTTTITATSPVDETVYGTCEVTVKTYDVTLTGALQDVNGNPQLFSWNLETDKTWSKTADLSNNINAITYGNDVELIEVEGEEGTEYDIDFKDDVMYQMNTSGYLYKVDLTSGETLETSAATVAFGAPVDDMEYGYISSQLFGEDILFGVYGGYLLYSNPAMGNTFNYGWNLAKHLSTYTGSSSFTTISWVGYTKNNDGNYVDVFYCLDDSGSIWLLAPDLQLGGANLAFFGTDLNLSFPGYSGTYYCSMVLGEDDNLYLSYFDGSTNQIYVLEENDDGDYNATLLGDVGDAVWPAGLLTVTSNHKEEEEETPTEDFSDVQWINVEEKAQQITLPAKTQTTGGLNAVKVSAENTEAAEIQKMTPTETGRVYMDLYADNSTNGLLTLEFDPEVLEFVNVTADCFWSFHYAGDGKLTVAYAAPVAMDTAFGTVTFRYVKGDGNENAKVTVTTWEENDNFEPSTEVVTLTTNGHTHAYTEVVTEATCVSDGYTTYVCECGDTYIDNIVAATGHKMVSEVTAPTHDKMGYTTYTCSECGYSIVNDYTDALDHEFVKTVTKEATCTEDGEMTFECECGESYTQIIPKKGHRCTSQTVAPTCTEFGYTLYQCGSCDFHYIGEIIPAMDCPSKGFADVKSGAWYHDAVDYVIGNKLMNGVSATSFAPDDATTRAMLAVLLYRMAGEPSVEGLKTGFTDLDEGAWYVDAVVWAANKGIVNGVTETSFKPNDTITREQMAVMLWRYAGQPEADEKVLDSFTDVKDVSGYAVQAVAWAVESGLIKGVGNAATLATTGSATRAQIATILMRYCEMKK